MPSLTIVIPAHNEEANIVPVFSAISRVMQTCEGIDWNILFVDDGSTDSTIQCIKTLAEKESHVQFIEFSRNFGKETATTAGLHHATGDAAIVMDADLQHPPELIPLFIEKWKNGADMVIGVRESNTGEGLVKKIGSFAFNRLMITISETKMIQRETDYRLVSRPVLDAFQQFTERGRMTRGLLNWLGFRRDTVPFTAAARENGVASYSPAKLVQLAINYFLSHSLFPLKFAGYLGMFISFTAGPVLCFMMVDRYLLGDPWNFGFSGPAILAMLNLSLIGIVLMCLGLVALYIGTIHRESMNRPLYVIRAKKV